MHGGIPPGTNCSDSFLLHAQKKTQCVCHNLVDNCFLILHRILPSLCPLYISWQQFPRRSCNHLLYRLYCTKIVSKEMPPICPLKIIAQSILNPPEIPRNTSQNPLIISPEVSTKISKRSCSGPNLMQKNRVDLSNEHQM